MMPLALVCAVGGMLAFLAVWAFLPAPVWMYVLGHELTHALLGILCGARVSRIKVGVAGGSVQLSKSNMLITLAPYFVPFYTMIVVLVACVVRCFVSPLPAIGVWLFAVGFTWCFHVCFTIRSLMQRQPDIQEYGHLFSYVLILCVNAAFVIVWLVCTAGAPASRAVESLGRRTCSAYLGVYESVRSLPFLPQ